MQLLITSSSFEFYILSAQMGLRLHADLTEVVKMLYEHLERISCSAWKAQIEHMESSRVLTQTRRSCIIILVIKMKEALEIHSDFKDIVVLLDWTLYQNVSAANTSFTRDKLLRCYRRIHGMLLMSNVTTEYCLDLVQSE